MLRNLVTFLCLALAMVSSVNGHGVQVAYCFKDGKMRIYVEHWHYGSEAIASNAGSMGIRDGATNLLIGGGSQPPLGAVTGTSKNNLPCDSGTTPTTVTTCPSRANGENQWVYFEFPVTTCNQQITYTLETGNTVVLQEGCTELYPAQVSSGSGGFADTQPPDITVGNGPGCPDVIVPHTSGASTQTVSFTTSVTDNCDPNPTITSVAPSSGTAYPVGVCTPVVVTAEDNVPNVGTCTFEVCVGEITPAPPTSPPELPEVSGDPFTSYNGKTTQFYMPPGDEQLLLACPGVELLGRTMASGIPGDTQQWFDHFTVRPPQGQAVSVGVLDWHALTGRTTTTGNDTATQKIAALLGSKPQHRPLTTLDVTVDGVAVEREATQVTAAKWKVVVERGLTPIGNGQSDRVIVQTGDLQIRMQSAVAEKFATAQEKLRHMHIDLDFDRIDAKPCSGVLPEIWGVKPMSASTARLLMPH